MSTFDTSMIKLYLVVVDVKNESIVGGCTVPHSRATTPDFSQVLALGYLDLAGSAPESFSPFRKIYTENQPIEML